MASLCIYKCTLRLLAVLLTLVCLWILASLCIYVTFADSYLRANIEFKDKACTRGKYYSYTGVYFMLSLFIYVYRHIYVRHVLAVALASLP